MSKLYENILSEYGKAPFRALKIPEYISQNLNKNLRTYQQDAIKLYLANNETFKKNHLMFNMATGSGKTLVMAALMFDCYKRGYRNFVFFVNSTSILEKTKSDFCADEAHHLNADTKKISKNTQDDNDGWEGIMNKAFKSHEDNLKPEDIINFYNLTSKSKEDELFKYSLEFFQKKFGDYEKKLAEYIQMAFKSIYQLNANNENQAKDNQIKLNTLEDKKRLFFI